MRMRQRETDRSWRFPNVGKPRRPSAARKLQVVTPRIGRCFVSFIRILYNFPFPTSSGCEDQAEQQGSGLLSHLIGCSVGALVRILTSADGHASRLVSETALFFRISSYIVSAFRSTAQMRRKNIHFEAASFLY